MYVGKDVSERGLAQHLQEVDKGGKGHVDFADFRAAMLTSMSFRSIDRAMSSHSLASLGPNSRSDAHGANNAANNNGSTPQQHVYGDTGGAPLSRTSSIGSKRWDAQSAFSVSGPNSPTVGGATVGSTVGFHANGGGSEPQSFKRGLRSDVMRGFNLLAIKSVGEMEECDLAELFEEQSSIAGGASVPSPASLHGGRAGQQQQQPQQQQLSSSLLDEHHQQLQLSAKQDFDERTRQQQVEGLRTAQFTPASSTS
jgi:hypothetical protein